VKTLQSILMQRPGCAGKQGAITVNGNWRTLPVCHACPSILQYWHKRHHIIRTKLMLNNNIKMTRG
jgi:hypothetical protein